MKKSMFFLFCLLSISLVMAEDDEQKVQQLMVGVERSFQLTGTAPYVGHYITTVKEQNIGQNKQRWYFFVMAQPKQTSTKLLGMASKIEIRKVPGSGSGTPVLVKQCKIAGETDACFIKNNQFDYKNDKIKISVHCESQCQFQLMTEVDSAYDLKMNSQFKLDFQNTAYSKIFNINTEGSDFYQLRISLQPKGFIKYGQPVVLLGKYGIQVPSKDNYDFKGIHTWNEGQGIFLRKSQMKQRVITLLVQGPERNVLDLRVVGWQKQQKMQLIEYWPEFDYLKASEQRQFQITVNSSLNATYRIKTITFSGSVQIFKLQKIDQSGARSTLDYSMPNLKYGEFQFRLSRMAIQKQKISKIIMTIAAIKQSTFIVNYGRQVETMSQIYPFISESSIMEPGQQDQYFIKIEQVIEQARTKKTSNIEIILDNIIGEVNATFYKCKLAYKPGSDNLKSCQKKPGMNNPDLVMQTPSKMQNRGAQKRFWFDITWQDYFKGSDSGKTQIVYQMVIVVQNLKPTAKSSYEIQYKNKDRIYLLRQGQLIKERVAIHQKRHYKLSFMDSDVSFVKIHFTKISGEARFTGSMVDPRIMKNHDEILPVVNVINYEIIPGQKVNQVFFTVKGLQYAYYSITAQLIRKSESSQSKKGKGYNQLIVRQDIPYQFLISPKDSIVLQIHGTQKVIKMNLRSTSTVQVCMTEDLQNPPFSMCDIENRYFLQMNQQLIFDRPALIGNIGIKNNNDFNVTIKIIMTKSQSNTCQFSLMNEVMFKMIDETGKDIKGENYHCIQYNLDRDAEVQLVVDFNKQYQYIQGEINVSLNDIQKIKMIAPSKIFPKEEIQSACAGSRSMSDVKSCFLKIQIKGIKSSRIKFMAQYTDQALRLMDGIAHSVHSPIKKVEPKLFYFAIHNYQNITVVLQNKVGQYKIYAKLLKYSQFAKLKQQNRTSQAYPTSQIKDFQSSNPFYYLQQIINIPKTTIQQKCSKQSDATKLFGVTWVDCVLTIAVTLDGSNELQKNGKFVIEATQKNRELKDGIPMSGYLQKKSIAFYNYQCSVANGTLIITVSNQNKQCLDMYLKQGAEKASASNSQKHSKAANSLIYNSTKVGTYSITVQANQNCPYTLTMSTSASDVMKLKKGVFTDIDMKLGQEKFYLFENLINETFKVLSMHRTGEVIISVKPILRENLRQSLKNINNTYDWVWSNKDSVKIDNVYTRNGQTLPHEKYCVDCYYLISVKAQRQTQASIVIPTPGTELPITEDSYIQQILDKNQNTTYRVFTGSKSQFQIHVKFGKINLTITQSDKNTTSFTKIYQPSKTPQTQQFSLSTSTETYQFLRYSRITIHALQQSYFSFAIVTNTNPDKRTSSGLKFGTPEYIFIEQDREKCVAGQMTSSIDSFLFVYGKGDKASVEGIEIVLKLEERVVSVDKEVGSNEMIVRVNSILGEESKANKNFNMCMKSKQPLSLTLIQSSALNYWPETEELTIIRAANLTFGAQGRTIIELNECKSRASAQIFSQFNDLKSPSSTIKQRRRTNNIVQFLAYGAVYAKIKADKGRVRWFAVNEGEGEGIGYDQYKVSWIRVVKVGGVIEVNVDPVRAVDQATVGSRISAISYKIYAAKEEMEMLSAMNCQQGQYRIKVVHLNFSSTQPYTSKQPIKAQFKTETDLLQTFSKYSYFLIGVKATVQLQLKSGKKQIYRFYYPYQQVSKQMLTGNGQVGPFNPDVDDNDEEGGLGMIGYVLIGLVVVVGGYYGYRRFCRGRKGGVRGEDTMGKEMKYFDFNQSH